MKIKVFRIVEFSSGESINELIYDSLDTDKIEDLHTLLHLGDVFDTNHIYIEENK